MIKGLHILDGSLLNEIWMSNPAMTAPTSGWSEIGLNFKLSRVQLSSAGIGSGYKKM